MASEELEEVRLQREAYKRGSWNEDPEEDGYWMSPDRKSIEMFFNWDTDPLHSQWIANSRSNSINSDISEEAPQENGASSIESEDIQAVASLLLDRGADIEAKGMRGWTPLQHRFGDGERQPSDRISLEVTRLLIDRGADIESPGEMNEGWTLLHGAALKRNSPEFANELIELGADINAKSDDNGNTPLHEASGYDGHEEVAIALIDAGADINAKDNDGNTPLHLAAQRDFLELASLLIDAGADINTKDNDGWTPLITAVDHRSDKVANLLIERGANFEAKDNDGRTLAQRSIDPPGAWILMNRHRNEG